MMPGHFHTLFVSISSAGYEGYGNTECKPCLQPKLTYHGILIRTWFYSILFVCLFEIDILLVFVYVCMFGCA